MKLFIKPLPDDLVSIQGKLRQLLLAIWNNQGISTHELTDNFISSNNLHDHSSKSKAKLERLGWEIKKDPPKKRCADKCSSWGWFLIPLKQNAPDL
jgi:hypothetical protein